jgi:hypothetical protein
MRAALLVLAGSTGCVAALHVTTVATVTSDSIAPAFTLTAQDGRSVSLATELAHGPVALVFYRGFW